MEDMAWTLRISEETIAADLRELSKFNIVEERDGRWYVSHFSKRQEKVSDAERQAQHREREWKERYYDKETQDKRECHEVVTIRDTETDKSRVETDKSRVEREIARRINACYRRRAGQAGCASAACG